MPSKLRLFLILPLLAGSFNAFGDIDGRVVRVLDGDTVEVLHAGKGVRVRLAGIDAPEKKQPYGQRSRQQLSRLIAQQQVHVAGDKTDRYGRLLGTVLLRDTDINAEQVRNGQAWAYRYRGKALNGGYATLEAQARTASKGLWADSDAQEPWKWRHNEK